MSFWISWAPFLGFWLVLGIGSWFCLDDGGEDE